MSKKRGQIGFSGGETSAYMAKWLIDNLSDEYEFRCVFANTGQELEETLEYVNRCDREFGLNLTWVEAVVNPEIGQGTRHKVVTFNTASRNGEPFEDVIKKYGIPSPSFPHCSRELKAAGIKSWADSIGWKKKSYEIFIGIRADEFDRMSTGNNDYIPRYILIENNITKLDINDYWDKMPFRLKIKGYQGNCKVCWKKSTRKLMTIAKYNPEYFDWSRRMETLYQDNKPANKPNFPIPARFFRQYLTSDDIIAMSKTDFNEAADDRLIFTTHQQLSLDISNGCESSCEAFN